MFKHYFKMAVRNLMKKKLYTFINIFGLAIGLAMCLAIISHISYESSFENFHTNKDRIYRVECNYAYEEEEYSSASVMTPLGKTLRNELPEISNAAVFRVWQIKSAKIGDKRHRIINEYEGAGYAHGNKLIFADADYFDVFTFPLVRGNPETALNEPFKVLISENAVDLYFNGQDPLGEVIEINDSIPCQVTGVFKNIPQNTQLYGDFIVSYSTLERLGQDVNNWNEVRGDYAYLLLDKNVDAALVEQKIPEVFAGHVSSEDAGKFRFRLKPLKDIYFNVYTDGNWYELYPGGEASVIYAFGIVAVFILIIAIANFINLSTARSSDRLKEVGVRKVLGALRVHLIRQYLGESVIIAFVSMLISVIIYEIFIYQVKDALPRQMLVDFFGDPMMLLSFLGLILIVGVIAGFYPALYLSRFMPIAILQGKGSAKSSRSKLRKTLVVFQFGIASVFIFITTILIRQTNLVTGIDLGFDRENMIVMNFDGLDAARDCKLMKNEIQNNTNALAVTAVSTLPAVESYSYHAYYLTEERINEERIVTKTFKTDYDFISTFKLQLVSGREFSPDISTDAANALIITESAADTLRLYHNTEPVGSMLYGGGDKFYEVIGIVKDFHGTTLDFGYKSALFIRLDSATTNNLVAKLPSENIAASISSIGNLWKKLLPDTPFEYTFLDEEIQAGYNEMRGQSKMFFAIALFAIGISCLGIFGLVSFTAEQRTKEIGIRKVLGATISNIITLLSKEFVLLVIIANLIAAPIGYLLATDFLSWQAFKVGIGVGTYTFVTAVGLFFALFTASFQSIKAALANPVDSMRYE